jgi:carboxypeptidase T
MPALLLLLFQLMSPALASEAPPSAWQRMEASPLAARRSWRGWQSRLPAPLPRSGSDARLEADYRFYVDVQAELAQRVGDHDERLTPFDIGRTVEGRPIWAWRVVDPGGPEIERRLLVVAQLHPIEWLGAEVATDFLLEMAAHPMPGVEVVVVPVLNVDGRLLVERDLEAGNLDKYRRTNGNRVDLNRDYTTNRTSDAVWQRLIPNRYTVSPEPLSQPETRALDALAATGFDVSVSLHAFGGYVYYPWAGLWDRLPQPDRTEHERLGHVISAGMPTAPYHVKQLGRWAFFFKGLGMEVDHMYAARGATSFLVELGRSGFRPGHPSEWGLDFRLYNPADPARATAQGFGGLRALARQLSWDAGY